MTADTLTAKGAATRARILRGARDLLIRYGYDAVILRDVAERAEMKLGNLQYYFSTRDALLEAVIAEEGQSDLEALRAAAAAGDGPHAALRNLVATLVGRWRGDSGVVFATAAFLAPHKPAFAELRRSIWQAFYREIEACIERAEPGLPPETYRDRSRLLTALIDGAAQQVQVGPKHHYLTLIAEQAQAIALPGAPVATRAPGTSRNRQRQRR